MINPYQPPESEPNEGAEPPEGEGPKPGNSAPAVGCGVGGCLIPTLLFIACAIAGDTGGPLIWPFFAVVFGVIGMIIGFVYQFTKGSRRDRRR